MANQVSSKKHSKLKPVLMVLSFLVSLYLIVGGVMLASDWFKIRPYKALASELDKTLGGGYKISYTWRCGLETSNCPSALMTKDINITGDEQVYVKLTELSSNISNERFVVRSTGECKQEDKYGYCRAEIKDNKTGLVVTLSIRPQTIFIDIQS